ncbi:MAG: galactokinase [Pyrinomonadaceae bacterium]|nr:galactokinase [Pyrinomonadaceae bacterium]
MLAHLVESAFRERFGTEPCVVRSPGRINLIGEHTDYNDGFVLPAAIERSIYVAAGKSDSDVSTAAALDLNESFKFHSLVPLPVSQGGWRNYILGVLSQLKKLGVDLSGFNIVFSGDIPVGAGLSSSAALTTGIVFVLNEVFDLGLGRLQMVNIAHLAEHDFVGVRCGVMDQFAALMSKAGTATLLDCRSLKYEHIELDSSEIEFVLLDSGVSHELEESEYNDRRDSCERVATSLGVRSLRDLTADRLRAPSAEIDEHDFMKALYVLEEIERVKTGAEFLRQKEFGDFGKLMFESHGGLKEKFLVSCEELDFLVELAIGDPHVLGARMVGAGFGGCTLNLLRKGKGRGFAHRAGEMYLTRFDKPLKCYEVQIAGGTELVKPG